MPFLIQGPEGEQVLYGAGIVLQAEPIRQSLS